MATENTLEQSMVQAAFLASCGEVRLFASCKSYGRGMLTPMMGIYGVEEASNVSICMCTG